MYPRGPTSKGRDEEEGRGKGEEVKGDGKGREEKGGKEGEGEGPAAEIFWPRTAPHCAAAADTPLNTSITASAAAAAAAARPCIARVR